METRGVGVDQHFSAHGTETDDDDEVMLVTNAEAWFRIALRPWKQDVHGNQKAR